MTITAPPISAPPAASPTPTPASTPRRTGDPRWARPALLALLVATAVLYIWGLDKSGWANAFYSAAAQADSTGWKAWFFGSLDGSNGITVDKPPAALWIMAASVKLFGLSSWSVLVPEALLGVASVGVLYAAVRRWSGPAAGLIAGAVLALTPVATLMFRFNNPDALLVLLLTLGAYAMVRAVERAGTRWLLLAGACVGFGFLTKMLQAFLVLPVFALVYLVAAPTPLRRRILQVLAAGGAVVLSAGWWIAAVALTPASARPYIGGSQTNSILELTLGYNGFGRLTGDETGSVGGGQSGWGATGWTRLFSSEIGGQIGWLLPAALILLAAAMWALGRAPRTDRTRAALLLWGGWLLVTGLVFSFMQGIFHAYYTVALAPAIGAVVGIGATVLWRRRDRFVLAATSIVTATWAYVLLARSPSWHPWLRVAILVVGLAAAVLVLGRAWLPRPAARLAAALALTAALAGPLAYSVSTASAAHTGAIPSAGPSVTSAMGGGGGPGGGTPAGGGMGRGGGQGGAGGGMGGLLNATTPASELTALLKSNDSAYAWVAATVGANNAAGYQLATSDPVLAVGGFNGTDPSPTLAQFKQYVAEGKIHYFIGGSSLGSQSSSGSSAAQEIADWVSSTYTATTVGGTTVYDLTS